MIEGLYETNPTTAGDHQKNYFISVLDIAVNHGHITAGDALQLLAEYQQGAAPSGDFMSPLGNIADSRVLNLNGLLRIVFRPEDHEYCTTGWL